MAEQDYPQWFRRLVEKWRLRLIPDWSVNLMPNAFSQDGEDNDGQSQANAVYRRINVWVNLEKGSKFDLEQTLVHELMHALLEVIDDAYNPAVQHMGKFERSLVERAVEAGQEHLIEMISRQLVALDHGSTLQLVSDGAPGYAE